MTAACAVCMLPPPTPVPLGALAQPHSQPAFLVPSSEERYAAGMIGKAATEGTERAPKEESFRHRHRRGGRRNFLPVPLQYSSLHLIPKVGHCVV